MGDGEQYELLGGLICNILEAECAFVANIWSLSLTKLFHIRLLTFPANFPTGWEVLYSFLIFLCRLIRTYKILWASLARANWKKIINLFNDWESIITISIHNFSMYLILAVVAWNKSLDNEQQFDF